MVMPSGLAAKELLLFLIANGTISGEQRYTELSSGHSLRSLRLTIWSLEWEIGEVNCLLLTWEVKCYHVNEDIVYDGCNGEMLS